MPDDDIIAAQKAINEAVKSADPALSSGAVPPTVPRNRNLSPWYLLLPPTRHQSNSRKHPELLPPPPPINEKEEKLVSEILESPVVPSETPHVASKKPLTPSGRNEEKSISGGIIAIVATLLLTLPVAVYFISQQNQQIAELRSRATAPLYPNPTATPRPPGDDDDNDDDDTTNPTATPTRPASTATPTTGTTPVCQNIKIYKERVVLVTDLSSLRAGDDVVLAVKGNLNPTKAHFRVNGGTWTETTFKNGSGEFTLHTPFLPVSLNLS